MMGRASLGGIQPSNALVTAKRPWDQGTWERGDRGGLSCSLRGTSDGAFPKGHPGVFRARGQTSFPGWEGGVQPCPSLRLLRSKALTILCHCQVLPVAA